MSKWLRKMVDQHAAIFWILSILILGELFYKPISVTLLKDNEWAITFLKLSISLLTILMVREMYERKITIGFRTKNFGKGFWLMLVPAIPFLIQNFATNFPYGVYADSAILCIVSYLVVGLFEEVLLRGYLVGNMMLHWKDDPHKAMKSMIFSSLIFGVIHLGNLLSGAPLKSTLFQVFYATALGFAFGAAFIRSKNIWAMILIHGVIDIFSAMDMMTAPQNVVEGTLIYDSGFLPVLNFLNSRGGLMFILMMSLYCVIASVWSFYLIRKSKREEINQIWAETAADI